MWFFTEISIFPILACNEQMRGIKKLEQHKPSFYK